VLILLHDEEKRRYNMAQTGNLETESGEVGYGEGKLSYMCGGGGGGIPCIVEMFKNVDEARGALAQQMAKHL
jgi:hypothetical protein